MKIVKIEKPNCSGCGMVGNYLDNEGVSYEKWDIVKGDADSNKARDILGELGIFSVPVTILLSETGEVISHVRGFDPPALEVLVQELNNH